MIVNRSENERVIGFHLLSPHAGEIAQGVAVAFTYVIPCFPFYFLCFRCGATKQDFDNTVGIHPTIAEEMNFLRVKKGSGEDPTKTGC